MLLGISKKRTDPELVELSKRLGFDGLKNAQRAPVALLGTPEEVVEEIHNRHRDTGMSYFIFVNGTKLTEQLFVNEVMPSLSE